MRGQSSQFTLHPGDRILLTTDGITETKDESGRMIGMEGLEGLAHTHNLDEIVDHLQSVQAGGEAQDDWTMIDIRFTGK